MLADIIPTRYLAPFTALLTCALIYTFDPRGDTRVLIVIVTATALTVYDFLHHANLFQAIKSSSIFVITHILSACIIAALFRLSPFHPLASFPGPILNRMTDWAMVFITGSGRRSHIVAEYHRKYGSIVRIAPNVLSINSVDAINPIYASAQALDKSEAYRPGRSPSCSLFHTRNKLVHNQRRRLWAGAFTPAALKSSAIILDKRTRELIHCVTRRSDDSGVVNIQKCIDHWSFDFMGDITFGGSNRIEFMQDGDPENLIHKSQSAIVAFEIFGNMPPLFDILTRLPPNEDYQLLEKLATKLLSARKQNPTWNEYDMCSFFLGEHPDTQNDKISEEDLIPNVVFAIAAGSDTSAAILTLILFYLISHPRVYERLVNELLTKFPDGEFTPEEHPALLELPYFAAVINEGLRLSTPFNGFPRVVPKGGMVLAGQFIPEGTVVGIPIYAQHVDPANFWPAPLEFRPERWLEGGLGPDTITRHSAFMAFQFGAFGCLGKPLAMRQLTVVLAQLILAYKITFAPNFDPNAFVKGWFNYRTNVLSYPLRVKAEPRTNIML